MQVNFQPIAPADITNTSVTLRWTSNPPANNDANGYVGTNAGNYGFTAPADQTGQLPGVSAFTATVNGLTPGTSYVAMAEADGANSGTQQFSTTGGVAPTVHLIPKGDDDGDGPDWEVKSGKPVDVKARCVKIGDPKTRLPNITVNFTATPLTGTGQLQQTSAVSNQRGIAKVSFVGGNPGNVQVAASSASADNQVTLTVHVRA